MKPIPNRPSVLICCLILAGLIGATDALAGREYHVAITGDDANAGTSSKPLRTIQAAADLAMPGDTITVHGGVYRERIAPPRGGTSEAQRITYQAAPGEKVVIKGSEVVRGWTKVQHDTWKITLPDSFFGDFNPYKNVVRGDWFDPMNRVHHLGATYLNGHWMTEAAELADVLKPAGENPLWFTEDADQTTTTIWAQLPGVEPNKDGIEINVREAVFYPVRTGIDYITVRGFTLEQASPNWAPPTAEQVGLIGTHWSKGWIIEDNTIRYSTCVGITLGKHGDEFDNTSQNSAEGYVETIKRALARNWTRQNIGHHIVRNNHVSHCEQAGIVGSMGPVFSLVTGNTIHDINYRGLFGGAEMAGIKFHGAIDSIISNNHIYRSGSFGIWLDWMNQGTRVTGNLLHDNRNKDLFLEVNHGPFLVDNNIALSKQSLLINSQGGAYVHNLFAGSVQVIHSERRLTPYHPAHSTEVADLAPNPSGDDRYYNNLFVGHNGLTPYDPANLPVFMGGNVFLAGARASKYESDPIVQLQDDPGVELLEKADGIYLRMKLDKAWLQQQRPLVTTKLLGKAKIPGLPYVQPDDSPYRIDTDYFGKPRKADSPLPGPFSDTELEPMVWKVWPRNASQ